jgi:Tfp pilus assembly protein PilV
MEVIEEYLILHQMVLLQLIKNNSGQTILEAVIALGALLLILSASAVAIVTSVNNATFTRNQNQANKLAQAGIEEMRNLRNTNYTDFKARATGSPTYCMGQTPLGSSPVLVPATSSVGQKCEEAAYQVKPDANTNYTFARTVKFIENDTSECILKDDPAIPGGSDLFGTKVRVTVKWTSGRCQGTPYCHSSYVESCFFPPL